MVADYGLILAAGFGTRMGPIGKKVPKVLWPIFEKKLLSLQVDYLRQYNVKKIFINLHHNKELILKECQNDPNFEEVEFLIEDEILDIGGAVHNLANHVDYQGRLVLNNADQFIFLNQDLIDQIPDQFEAFDSILFGYEIETKDKYNIVETDQDNKMLRIIDKSEVGSLKTGLTYTGLAFINLNKLTPSAGVSRFFETVANFKKRNISFINIKDSNYWDFGTLRRYYNSCFEIIKSVHKPDQFIQFLLQNNAIDMSKIKSHGYKSDSSINLTDSSIEGVGNIYLKGSLDIKEDHAIIFEDIIEKHID
jgi:NDP-sugar pyrophosphorylase family protein